ncbi:MAG: L-2-amino-thiazoline-4-carboxylic acid hydrolase [Clostridia bacterium]|nr:L-2-amino-thiazoline-4-carboxylic acid hydrolase [Clostridia bacterium]
MSKLDKSFVYKGFRTLLAERNGEAEAQRIWADASLRLAELEKAHPGLDSDSRMMILPAAALYQVSPETLPLMREYAADMGRRIGRVIHGVTSIPGVSWLLWSQMPRLMRTMSSPEKGYQRRIVSETKELVGVDILSCPLHEAAKRLGVPEVAAVVCAMDKAYMTGFKFIQYTRTTAIGEGDACCDYRLRFDPDKK